MAFVDIATLTAIHLYRLFPVTES